MATISRIARKIKEARGNLWVEEEEEEDDYLTSPFKLRLIEGQ